MRKIIQFCLILITVNLVVVKIQAQLPKALVFANFTYANPANTAFKNYSNYGAGYELGGGIGFGKTILMASIGQVNYHYTPPGGVSLYTKEDFKITPIKFGLRRYLLLGLFLNGNLGVASGNSKTNFLYEAGAGYKLGFFEVGAAYTGFKIAGNLTANAVLLKAGLAIKI